MAAPRLAITYEPDETAGVREKAAVENVFDDEAAGEGGDDVDDQGDVKHVGESGEVLRDSPGVAGQVVGSEESQIVSQESVSLLAGGPGVAGAVGELGELQDTQASVSLLAGEPGLDSSVGVLGEARGISQISQNLLDNSGGTAVSTQLSEDTRAGFGQSLGVETQSQGGVVEVVDLRGEDSAKSSQSSNDEELEIKQKAALIKARLMSEQKEMSSSESSENGF